jgi:hypothetical protein
MINPWDDELLDGYFRRNSRQEPDPMLVSRIMSKLGEIPQARVHQEPAGWQKWVMAAGIAGVIFGGIALGRSYHVNQQRSAVWANDVVIENLSFYRQIGAE